MNYYLKTLCQGSLDSVKGRLKEVLSHQGFGVLTEVDMQSIMQSKMDKEIEPYLILGTCHPVSAAKTLELDPHLGLMMPCNFILRALPEGIEVATMDPMVMLAPVSMAEADSVASELHNALLYILSNLNPEE